MKNDKPMLEERQERAPRDVYGGRMIEKKGKGFTRTVLVLVCDSCGLRIGETDRLRACSESACQAKICDDCAFVFEGQIFCQHCFKSKLDGMEESDLAPLQLVITARKTEIPQIASQLNLSSNAVRESLQRLVKANLISRCSVSILTQFEPTASAVYNKSEITRLFTSKNRSALT